MKIKAMRAAGLRGGTPEGDWATEIKPNDCIHTLVAVYADEGVVGWGSAFTNDALVEGSLRVLEPLCLGENPLEPERVSEKLHANTFWLGRGGAITHTISAIRYCDVGHSRKSLGTAGRPPAWWPLPRSGSPLCLSPYGRTGAIEREDSGDPCTRISSVQNRQGVHSVAETTRRMSRLCVRRAKPSDQTRS